MAGAGQEAGRTAAPAGILDRMDLGVGSAAGIVGGCVGAFATGFALSVPPQGPGSRQSRNVHEPLHKVIDCRARPGQKACPSQVRFVGLGAANRGTPALAAGSVAIRPVGSVLISC